MKNRILKKVESILTNFIYFMAILLIILIAVFLFLAEMGFRFTI